MIITQEVNIKANSKLTKHYKDKGYNFKYLESFTVKVSDLSIGSHAMVIMCCDNCKHAKEIRYQTLKDKVYYNWLCTSCEKIKQYQDGRISNFNDKILQKELSNRNKDERKLKSKITKKEKYGDEYYSNRKQRSETMLEKYNNENFSNPEKRKETMFKEYGGYFNNPEKRKETCLEKYGVDAPFKVPEIFLKMQKSAFTIKTYKDYDLYYQGSYELKFLEFCETQNIISDITNGHTIHYKFIDKDRIYYPDFYFKKLNLIVEVKSTYTFNFDLDKNLAKRTACIERGYNFIFVIDNKFEAFHQLIP